MSTYYKIPNVYNKKVCERCVGVCVVNVCVVYNLVCVCVCVYFCPLFRCIHRKPIKAFCSVDTMLYIIHSVYAVAGGLFVYI